MTIYSIVFAVMMLISFAVWRWTGLEMEKGSTDSSLLGFFAFAGLSTAVFFFCFVGMWFLKFPVL